MLYKNIKLLDIKLYASFFLHLFRLLLIIVETITAFDNKFNKSKYHSCPLQQYNKIFFLFVSFTFFLSNFFVSCFSPWAA